MDDMKAKTYIKKLTIQGFKSFNRKTSIPFLPGMNVITGPNGSGKSNVIDAISFVLGRISAKSLRAGRLKELIFHGSQTKKPAEFASVTIHFDNSKKAFPFDTEEVTITRKINRKGVSVYRLNGRNTTREKILQVLESVWIRPDGHNIIQQGDITQIIEMNPIERREIIDEISGIKEYNEKKEKALRDLEKVDQKLREAQILISQRYEIYKKLEAERNAALKYKELQLKLKILKGSYFLSRKKELNEQLGKVIGKLAKRVEEKKSLEESIYEIEEKLKEKEEVIKEIAKKVVEISKRVEIEKKISELRSKILVKKNEIDMKRAEIERLDRIIDNLESLHEKKLEIEGGMPPAVKAILRMNLRGVYGTVAQLIKTDSKYEIAIEVAAGPHLYDIIVEDEDVASFCIEFLRRERIGRATFIPLNKIRPITFKNLGLLNKEGVIGIASRLIKYNPKFMPAMEFVFGNTLIVKDLEAAKNVGITKARMVTLDGDLIERSGVMVGGYYVRKHPHTISVDTEKQLENYIQLRKQLRIEIENLEHEVKELEKELKKFGETKETSKMLELDKVRIASEREIDKLREKRRRLNERKINLEIEINRLEMEKERLEKEIEEMNSKLEEFKGMELFEGKSWEIERDIKRIERELEKLGPINFKAIEEFEKIKEEFEEYKEKYEKILKEKESVLKMIEEIENKRKEVFLSALNKISDEFSRIFNKMTGGSGALRLEDPENIESGLIIEANPAGKKLLNIDAMSGGEKSLVALAFLFAIQSFRPSPFYLLDEIDAALDRRNSRKVAQFIKNASKNSQFIVISHNEETIKFADRVYGVTMIDGESKIVALELPK